MSEADISPLARRLAEENNVDWRVLQGSGAGGKVVERDVLEFLARVMAGEEELDPTPEPVPDGMESWPAEDIRSFQDELRASRKNVGLDDIQKELSASDRMGGAAVEDVAEARPAPAWEAGPVATDDEPVLDVFSDEDVASDEDDLLAPAAQADDGAISEDIFLFDDDDGEPAEIGTPEPLGAVAPVAEPGEELDDELLIAGDDALGGGDAGGAAAREPDDLWAGALEPEEEHDALPDVFGGSGAGAATGASAEAFGATASGDVPDLDVSDLPDLGGLGDVSEAPAPGGTALSDLGFDLDEEPTPVAANEDVLADEDVSVVETSTEFGHSEREWDDAIRQASFRVDDEGVAAAEADTDGQEATEATDELEGVVADDDAVADLVTAESGADEADVAFAAAMQLPLVSYGTLLRRHVDLTALAGAQLVVSQELGYEDPLSPTAFLLRAAAKAVTALGWEGDVGLADLRGEGPRVQRLEGAADRSFRDVLEAVRDPDADGAADGCALVVADMSELGVDEAVLNLGAPVLTLGRILYDNQRGSYRSTLALSGDVAAESGAALLARVAELLDAPVRLVL